MKIIRLGVVAFLTLTLSCHLCRLDAEEQGAEHLIFVEAESFTPSDPAQPGWIAIENSETRKASRARTLWGADGPGDAVATRTISIPAAGKYRVWVRFLNVGAWRGPFRASVFTNGQEIASHVFDVEADSRLADWEYTWQSFDVDLPTGDVKLALAKHEQKNCVGYVRHVDCLLLTTDLTRQPDHVPFGPQTLLRVTLSPDIRKTDERPVYLHLFADHYRDPWYAHFAIGQDGVRDALAVAADQMLKPGEPSAWCNLSKTIYQDSGAALNFSLRHSYHEKAARFQAKLEFGVLPTAAAPLAETKVVKTFDVEAQPNGLVVVAPPDLASANRIAQLKRDRDFADEIGRQADAFAWPDYGRRPRRIPFLVTVNIGGYELPVDKAVADREHKTLDYFGFNGGPERILHGQWFMQENSYARPDLAQMKERAQRDAATFHESGRKLEDLACCMLMDEPTAQPASFLAQDAAYMEKFREWLRAQQLQPADLLVESWEQVRPVAESERDRSPALHYYTQRFRTRALGDFMSAQRYIIAEAYGNATRADGRILGKLEAQAARPAGLPTLANFSDGAVYHANFYGQGVDYFELLDADDQNAIWGEDWANNSSTFQCAGFNVALMQAAARKRGQTIGHYLIAHAGRTPWDIKTKAVSETARGVRMWMNFSYGPSWGSHEGGPPARSHLWWGKPELWRANAEITREIGAVEDWLLTAQPAPAEVAVVYSSSADIWTMDDNLAFGFDRMHSWLALTHAQVPTDILSERDVASGMLMRSPMVASAPPNNYRVCYLSGPNLTRAAAAQLKTWVEAGGTLWLTAGAASRDEFNRPLEALSPLLPAERTEVATLEPYRASGRFLTVLHAQDSVLWSGETLEVLSVKQLLQPKPLAETLATFQDGSPAVVRGPAGNGRVICCGFLPALSYIKPALVARQALDRKLDERKRRVDEAQAKAGQDVDQPAATNNDASEAPQAAAATGLPREIGDHLSRSANPWEFPGEIRERILAPVRIADVQPRVACNMPLVDVVTLPCEQGLLIALSNFSMNPVDDLQLTIRESQALASATSVRHGLLQVTREGDTLQIQLPLAASDFIMVPR